MIAFGDQRIGDGEPVFVTFEAGPTHSGVESAKRLIDLAADAGGNAIKFQILDPDRLVADREQLFTYDVLIDKETGETETVSEPLYDILCRRALSADEWREVKRHADTRGIAFFATIGFPDEIDFVVGLGCNSIKIASADVTHFPLIRQAARTGICLQLDTGNSTIGEVEQAVELIQSEGNSDIIIHHCPSGYPAPVDGINLNIIPTLKRMFGVPVAFSDHSPSWEMDVAAVALGANLVEKTITEDRTTRSVEHVMSLEPQDMRAFADLMRALPKALGSSRREMSAAERKKSMAVRRSAFARQDLEAGTVLGDEHLEYRRPGYGIPPTEAEALLGRRLRVSVEAGAMLDWSQVEAGD